MSIKTIGILMPGDMGHGCGKFFLDNKLNVNKATRFQLGLVDRFRCHVSLLVFSVENVQIIGRSHSNYVFLRMPC
jgi:hypothetical protein